MLDLNNGLIPCLAGNVEIEQPKDRDSLSPSFISLRSVFGGFGLLVKPKPAAIYAPPPPPPAPSADPKENAKTAAQIEEERKKELRRVAAKRGRDASIYPGSILTGDTNKNNPNSLV